MLHRIAGLGAIAGGLMLALTHAAPALSCGNESGIIRARGLTPADPPQTLYRYGEYGAYGDRAKAYHRDDTLHITAPVGSKQSQVTPNFDRSWSSGNSSGIREEAFTRCSSYGGPDRLTALTPERGQALTLSNTPTLLVYVPQTRGLMASVWVFNETDQTSREYSVQLPEQAGILVIDLVSLDRDFPLQSGVVYDWGFEILAGAEPGSNPIVTGLIARQPVDAVLAQALSHTSLRDRLDLYTQAGLWYDALATAAALHRAEPGNRDYTQMWHAMLDSVGLAHLADQPLLEIPAQPQSISSPVEP